MIITRLFSLTIFTSSFLLFLIQPMMGKYLLPFFGGSASVWTVVMLFFMSVLLLGYWYAHILSRLPSRTAFVFHVSSLMLGVFLLWLHFRAWGTPLFVPIKNTDFFAQHPTALILFVLTESIGIQYFLLSATSSFLQSWYARISHQEPFWLYALSSVASLLAIALYPFFVEPFISLRSQSMLFGAGFVFFGVLMVVSLTAFLFVFQKEKEKNVFTAPPPVIETRTLLSWLGYSTLGALLLLVCTTYASAAVAPIPFLWLSPLALYLTSFAVTFTKNSVYRREYFVWGTAFLLLGAASGILFQTHVGIVTELLILYAALFSSLIFCHGELYSRHPPASALSVFYLIISFGGVLAGILVVIVFPLVFNGYWEFCLTLFSVMISVSWYIVSNKKMLFRGAALFVVLGILVVWVMRLGSSEMQRNFYGVILTFVKNTPRGEIRNLANGVTVHGIQFIDPKKAYEPTSYYGRSSGIGRVFEHYREWKGLGKDEGIRAGVVGLGIGTLSAYCLPNDTFMFYEINPAVIDFAKKYFTYLSHCPAHVSIATGDARLLLAQEEVVHNFDVLAIDAFSDDSVPMHLLTREAFGLYLSRLSDGGILAVHVSSRYLDLVPVVGANAQNYGLYGTVISSLGDGAGVLNSTWAVLSKDEKSIAKLMSLSGSEAKPLPEKQILWTDDYSNLFSVLK